VSSFLSTTLAQMRGLKEMAERALAQVDDDAFFRALDRESNSLAIIVKHLGGNMRSRWTDFLTSDGEKPDRDRDGEFEIRTGDTRASLMALWAEGWSACFKTLESMSAAELRGLVSVRGESMTAETAILRAYGHTAQHVGQIVFLAKHLNSESWKTLSIPRGQSKTWQPGAPTGSTRP
jgi:hypothetical protein